MLLGIDFGTTNTKIAAWDSAVGGLPQLQKIGKTGELVMPSVIAYRRRGGGGAEVEAIGEEADQLPSERNRVIIRNIKRWALASDKLVYEELEAASRTNWPTWLNLEKRSLELWGQSIPIREVIREIISEALERAELQSASLHLKAACPVHADLNYRRDLVDIFGRLGFTSKISWVTEEPLLFLALAYSLQRLSEGSYLIYDFGGGSFDCAIATIEDVQGTVTLTVYGADGDPLLGGMDIDEALGVHLEYSESPYLLRCAKEAVCQNPGKAQPIPAGRHDLTYADVQTVLRERDFIARTVLVLMKVYRQAKLAWKRPATAPPLGEYLLLDSNDVIRKTVWDLTERDLAVDIDKVILFGGTTRIPAIVERLHDIFGPTKVVPAAKLISAFDQPDITGVALGACYQIGRYVPLCASRLPCRVILRICQTNQEQKTEYVPFSRFPVSTRVPLFKSTPLKFSSSGDRMYSVTVLNCDDEVLNDVAWRPVRFSE